MKQLSALAVAALSLAACATAQAQPTACRPAGYDRTQLEALKAAEWNVADDAARNTLARALTACLGDPDPAVRDGLAFEGLQHWMRNGQLTGETVAALNTDLQARLIAPDPEGFQRPFSALVLAEVARTDRVQPWMTADQRTALLDASINYLTGIRDYRGFVPGEGYRHATAHAADLMLQLTLNPAFDKPQLTRIRDAIASQIAPADHFYVNGESERLATPILYMARRNVFTEEEWTAWLTQISGPGPLGASWDGWFLSNAGLARRHNLNQFVNTIYVNARLGGDGAFAVLAPGAEAAIRSLP